MIEQPEPRWTRRALLATALAFPAVHVPRTLFGGSPPARPPEPLLGHVVLVTFTAARPATLQLGQGGALARLRSRALTIGPVFADADSTIAAATSLLVGSSPRAHGVRTANDRAPSDVWSLPRAALAAGYHTAALSTGRLASSIAVPGFAETREDDDSRRIAALACERIERHAQRALFMWVNAPAFVDGRQSLDAVLVALLERIESLGTLDRTTLVVTALPSEAAAAEDALIVPFLAQYPGAIGSGSNSRTLLALSDVAPGLRLQYRLPGPDELGTRLPTGRGPSFVTAGSGGQPYEVVRCEGAFGVALRAPGPSGRFPGVRAILRSEHGRDLSKALVQRIAEPDAPFDRGRALEGKERDQALALLANVL